MNQVFVVALYNHGINYKMQVYYVHGGWNVTLTNKTICWFKDCNC